MFEWINNLLLSTDNFMPHGACYLWLPSILWLHIISDSIITLAYYSIPFALWYFVKKRTDLAYRWVFVLFGTFIFLCGTSHLISIWTIWHPDYWLDGLVKFATALVSIGTGLLIWSLIPELLKLPSPQILQTSETYLRAIFNATPDAMLINDEQGIITMINQQAESLLGYSSSELLGQTIEVLVPEQFHAGHAVLRRQYSTSASIRAMETGRIVKIRRNNGSELDVEISLSPIQTEQGLFFASAIRDITERKDAEARLLASEARFRRMANSSPVMIWMTDAVGEPSFVNQSWLDFTGLDSVQAITHEGWISIVHPDDRDIAFKAYYQDAKVHQTITTEYRLRNAKGEWRWILDNGIPLSDENEAITGYIGSAIDDSLGHLAGDELLQQVATRITARLRGVDMVARLGGDEFVVLLEDLAQPEDAARIAEDIITDLSKPFCLTQSDNILIGTSIGIALYPRHGDSPETLMDHADAALYQAKDAGRGGFSYFSEDLTRAAQERIKIETRLRHAIDQQELRVFYQPQVDITTGNIVGAEALVRWQDPVNGLIQPLSFIPIAEEIGLIVEIGAWVLHETCRQGRQWLDKGGIPLTLAVNVSPFQFQRSDMSTLVATVLKETGFPAEQLELEITETGLMGNQDQATIILNNLRAQGIRLAIDDFGTGYSSLAYLKHFPLDVLKIDKSFIDDIPYLSYDMEIAATIIAMGHILGIKVLAEGVETPEQLAFLKEKGCDSYQGFLKSRPIPAEDFAMLVLNQQRDGLVSPNPRNF